ncbi:uncharacterized protein [Asterias amurensis]|uniref:uncharacterized protein n=1 Tax=Asterias amurensis TaxID=7602 RepID=UPI003AB374C9
MRVICECTTSKYTWKLTEMSYGNGLWKQDDVYLDCMSMGMHIAKQMALGFPVGTTLRMRQSNLDVMFGNQRSLTKGDSELFRIERLIDSTRRHLMTSPFVVIDYRLQGFLGYSAEIETNLLTKHDTSKVIIYNTTSSLHAASQTNDVILQYIVPIDNPESNPSITLLRREEAIVLEREASMMASSSSRTTCLIISESSKRTNSHNDCKVVDRGGSKTEWSCDCRHEDDVTFFIKVYSNVSETMRWIYTISCVASFICITSAWIRLICVRCWWKSDDCFIRVNFLVAVAATSINLLVSLQAIDIQLFCKANVIVLHLSFIATPAWMVCQSIEVFIQSRKPLHGFIKSLPKRRIYALIGWGVPIVTVAVTVGTDMSLYGSRLGCLADFNSTLLWLFVVPVIAATMVISCLLILSTNSLVYDDQKGLNLKDKKQEMCKFACLAVLTTTGLILMPISLRSPPFGILTAIQWLFIIANAIRGLATLFFSYRDTKEPPVVSKRVSGFVKTTSDKLPGEPSKEVIKKTKGRDRGASYIDIDFTPIVPTSIVPTSTPVIGDKHEDNFNLGDGADSEDFPEVALQPVSCSPRSDSQPYSDVMAIPGSVSDKSNYVEQVKVTHRFLEKGIWHIVEEEKVVRKVYRRPQTKRETTAV